MTPMCWNLQGMVADWLKTHGYDGLCNPGVCACLLDDLCPGGDYCPGPDCQAGYRVPCDGSCDEGKCRFHVVAEKPSGGES